MGGKKPKVPNQPSREQIEKEQRAIEEKERTKMAEEAAMKEKRLQDKMKETESKRQALVGGLSGITDEEEQRRRFLKGA